MAIDQFSRSMPMTLYRALDVVLPRFRALFKEFGITEQQWRVLRVLWDTDRIAIGELGELALIPAPSLVGVVDRLEAAELVIRERNAADRRVVHVRMTAAGKERLELLLPRVATAYADLKRSVDGQLWEGVLAGLEQIIARQADTSH